MARWDVTWESGPQAVEIPDRNLAGLIERPEIPRPADPVAETLAAIDAPLGCPPPGELARPGQRVALLVTDWHDALFGVEGGVGPALLDRLNAAGVPDERITVVHAAGMHGHHRGRQKVGEAITGRVRYIEHNPLDEAELGKLMVFSGVREYPIRIKCATLAWHTMLAALKGQEETVSTE